MPSSYTVRPTLILAFDSDVASVGAELENSEFYTKRLLARNYHLGFRFHGTEVDQGEPLCGCWGGKRLETQDVAKNVEEWLRGVSDLAAEELKGIAPRTLFPNVICSLVLGAPNFESGLALARSLPQRLSQVTSTVTDPVLIVSIPGRDSDDDEQGTALRHRELLDKVTHDANPYYGGRVYIIDSKSENGYYIRDHGRRAALVVELLASSPFSNHNENNLPESLFRSPGVVASREYYVVNARVSARRRPWELFFTKDELLSLMRRDRGPQPETAIHAHLTRLTEAYRECVAQDPRTGGELEKFLASLDKTIEAFLEEAYRDSGTKNVFGRLRDLVENTLEVRPALQEALRGLSAESTGTMVVERRGWWGTMSRLLAGVRWWLVIGALSCLVSGYLLVQFQQLGWEGGLALGVLFLVLSISALVGREDHRTTYTRADFRFRLRALASARLCLLLDAAEALARGDAMHVEVEEEPKRTLLATSVKSCRRHLGTRAKGPLRRAVRDLSVEDGLATLESMAEGEPLPESQGQAFMTIERFLQGAETERSINNVVKATLREWIQDRPSDLVAAIARTCPDREDLPFRDQALLSVQSSTAEWLLLSHDLADPALDTLEHREGRNIYFGCPAETTAAHVRVRGLRHPLSKTSR